MMINEIKLGNGETLHRLENDIKEINIKFIPHDNQRYETVGDYFIEDNILTELPVCDGTASPGACKQIDTQVLGH